jgi:hypothetical protein
LSHGKLAGGKDEQRGEHSPEKWPPELNRRRKTGQEMGVMVTTFLINL